MSEEIGTVYYYAAGWWYEVASDPDSPDFDGDVSVRFVAMPELPAEIRSEVQNTPAFDSLVFSDGIFVMPPSKEYPAAENGIERLSYEIRNRGNQPIDGLSLVRWPENYAATEIASSAEEKLAEIRINPDGTISLPHGELGYGSTEYDIGNNDAIMFARDYAQTTGAPVTVSLLRLEEHSDGKRRIYADFGPPREIRMTGVHGEIKHEFEFEAPTIQFKDPSWDERKKPVIVPEALENELDQLYDEPAFPESDGEVSGPVSANMSDLAGFGKGPANVEPFNQQILELQRELSLKGFDVGSYSDGTVMLDGKAGPLTRAGIMNAVEAIGVNGAEITYDEFMEALDSYNPAIKREAAIDQTDLSTQATQEEHDHAAKTEVTASEKQEYEHDVSKENGYAIAALGVAGVLNPAFTIAAIGGMAAHRALTAGAGNSRNAESDVAIEGMNPS